MDKKKITIIIIAGLALLVCITALIGVGLSRKNNVELVSIDIVEEISTAEPSTEEINSVVETTEISTKNTTEIATDQTSSSGGTGSSSTENNAEATNGGSKDLASDLQQQSESTTSTDAYYTKTESGTYEFTPEFIAIVQETKLGEGATASQITDYFNNVSSALLKDLDYGVDFFMESLDIVGGISPIAKQQPSTASSSTSSSNQQSSNQQSSSNQSASNNTPSSSSSESTSSSTGLPAGWIPDDQLPPANISSADSGPVGPTQFTQDDSGKGPLTSNYDIGVAGDN